MTEQIFVILAVAVLALVAVIATMCRYAPMGDQSEDRGFFYTQGLGGDHGE